MSSRASCGPGDGHDAHQLALRSAAEDPRAGVLRLLDAVFVAFLVAVVLLAPSFGPARNGELSWLVAGPTSVVEAARPVLDALGERVLVVGTGQEADRLKLVVNTWMTAATVAANRPSLSIGRCAGGCVSGPWFSGP
jgi:hypothetical protein